MENNSIISILITSNIVIWPYSFMNKVCYKSNFTCSSVLLCGYQKIKDDMYGSHPISIGQHYLYDICPKNDGQDVDKPQTPPGQENGEDSIAK